MFQELKQLQQFGLVENGILKLIQEYSKIKKYIRKQLDSTHVMKHMCINNNCDFCTSPRHLYKLNRQEFLKKSLVEVKRGKNDKHNDLACCFECFMNFCYSIPTLIFRQCACGNRALFQINEQVVYCKPCYDRIRDTKGLSMDEAIQLLSQSITQ